MSTDKFLIVPGIEYSDPTNTTHVLVWGDVPFIGEGLPTGDLLAAAHALGGIAVLAHPWRKDAWSTFDPEWTQYLFGIELWNRKSDGWCPEKRVALTLKRSSLLPFVSLDFHRPRQFFPLRMQLVLDGPLREQSVLDALRARRCRPRLFGLSALGFTSGAPYAAARIAERTRASVMATARRMALRRRLRNAEPRNPDPRDAVES